MRSASTCEIDLGTIFGCSKSSFVLVPRWALVLLSYYVLISGVSDHAVLKAPGYYVMINGYLWLSQLSLLLN